jgi:hypothetical protein
VVCRTRGLFQALNTTLQHFGNVALVAARKGFGDLSGKCAAAGLLAYTDNEETGSTIYCLPKSYLLNRLKLSS